jgi:hypothetical protein
LDFTDMTKESNRPASIASAGSGARYGSSLYTSFHRIGLDPHSRSELDAFMRAHSWEPIDIDMRDIQWNTEISDGEALETTGTQR